MRKTWKNATGAATIVVFQRGDAQERAVPVLRCRHTQRTIILLTMEALILLTTLLLVQAAIQAEATEALVIKIFSWIWRCFKNRLAETSTWGGIALFWFGFIHGSEIEMLIGLFAIFVPESIWDAFFEKKGKELKDKLDGKAETTPQ